MAEDPVKADKEVPRNRLIAGAVIFVTGHMAPVAIPIVANSSLPSTWRTALSGLLLMGVPEIATVLTVIVLGKAGFDTLKSRLLGSVKRTLLPSNISRPRYYAGLILFLIPVLIGWASPYFYEAVPVLMRHRLTTAITGDLALILGVCLMGGPFWDKLRAIVVYDAEVIFPSAAAEFQMKETMEAGVCLVPKLKR